MYKYLFLPIIILLLFSNCSTVKTSEELKILPRSYWSANEPSPFKVHIPEKITIHHEGVIFNPEKDTAASKLKRVQVWGMGEERNWSDIPYHFLIDFDGNILEGRNVFTQGETATEYNPEGHLLITCFGNFEEQEVTPAQYQSLVNLIVYSIKKFNITADSIKGHKDFANTLCPGKNLHKYLEDGSLINDVKAKLK
ncbi:MAG: peptidoglycan recognition family protein [Ignavibacteria bacterium]|nr:peptidoglycan recognition family protein [Ignavibacteria bacterium]